MRAAAVGLVIAVALISVNPASGLVASLGMSSPGPRSVGFEEHSTSPQETFGALADGPTHDLTVSASNATALAGMSVNFTATIGGVSPTSITWWWGDGTTSTVSSNPTSHAYANPGIYLIYAQGTNSTGGIHDNLDSLLRFAVLDSYANDALGNEVQIEGSVVANTSTTSAAQGVLTPGGWIQVSNWVTNLPTNPQWTLLTPSYSVSASAKDYTNVTTILGSGLNLSAATISWSNRTPQGSYALNFSVPDVNDHLSPSNVTWNNFTFTMFISVSASTPVVPIPSSPHNGTLEVYQVTSAGYGSYMTLDPALADDATDGPILQNIYQTLIVYNGSKAGPDPSDFVPDLATCVPGSTQCVSMYGSSLVSGDNWTFVINPNATFYNGTTGASWSVYPNDVAFSFARSCALSNLTGLEGFEDFVLCQALLPSTANSSWDGGLHYPYNNTPANILNAMTVNSSLYCTALMEDGIHGNGCITLDTSASGRAWPEFLEFVESTSGWAITSCSWAASEGLGLPGWFSGTTCYPAPPGSSGNPNPIPSNEAWDGYERTQGSHGSVPTTALRYHALGSGPYYLVSFDNVTGYSLKANPDWGGTTCVGSRVDGCLPGPTKGGLAPSYIPDVVVHFESSNGPGLAAMASGNADLIDTTGGGGNAGYGGNGTIILDEVKAGQLDYVVGPAVTENYAFMELEFNVSAASSIMGSPVTLPSGALQDLNFRQFLIAAYPHLSTVRDECLVEGILYCFTTGGAIPAGLGNYYPTNISWPLTNADTNPLDVGGAAWWWSQVASDSDVGAACTSAAPCTFPIPAITPTESLDFQMWCQAIDSISHGAIRPSVVNVTWLEMILSTFYATPGNATFPIGWYGWAPDYFDPSDYADPIYLAQGLIAGPLRYGSYLSPYNSSCSGPMSDPSVTSACQGTAYADLNSFVRSADVCSAPSCSVSQRALLYNMAERIADGLGLYSILYQQAAVYAFAPWIGASSLLINPDRNNVYGGATSNQPFFFIQYATAIPQGYTLDVVLGSPGASLSGSVSPARIAPATHVEAGLTLEAGETFLMLVSVVGGTGIYHYLWSGLPEGCTSVNSAVLPCRPTQGGNVSITVTVVDSKGDIGASTPLPLVVIPRLSIASFVATPSNVVLGKSVSFSLSTLGGIGPLSYSYLGLPSGCTSADATTLSCAPAALGHYSITASVTDAVGIQASATLELNVTPMAQSHSSTFLGLPGSDGYFVIGGVVIAALLAVVVVIWKRRPASHRLKESAEDSAAEAPSRSMSTEEGPTSTSALSSAPGVGLAKSVAGERQVPGPPSTKPSTTKEGGVPGVQICPACGTTNRSGAKYCDQCSTALRA